MIPTGDCPATDPVGRADSTARIRTPPFGPAPSYPQGIAGTHRLPCGSNRARMGCGLLTDSLPADADAGRLDLALLEEVEPIGPVLHHAATLLLCSAWL